MSADVLAYCQAYFSFAGVAPHAGASPWLGRSALDAAELMNVGVNFLREHMPPDSRIHYAFVDSGGPSPNVVQPTARLYYVVRAPDVPQVRALYERVVKVAEGAALMTETSLEVGFDGGSAELLQNVVLEQAMHDIAVRLGPVPFDAAAPRQRAGGSTDVGDVSWVVPTVQCLGAVAGPGSGHPTARRSPVRTLLTVQPGSRRPTRPCALADRWRTTLPAR